MAGVPKDPQFFVQAAGIGRENLVISYGHVNTAELAAHFAEAGERLAATSSGTGTDDMILMPYLTVMRQAVELGLKSAIAELAKTYRNYVNSSPGKWSIADLNKRLRERHGHKLVPLWNELDAIWADLAMPEALPASAKVVVEQLHDLDPSGVKSREVV